MAKLNHGIAIDIDDQVQLCNSKQEENEEVKIINKNDCQKDVFHKIKNKKNIIYRLLKHFNNLIFQLKFFFIIVIYSVLGALLFIYIEKDYDLALKQESYNYHLIARDMLFHNLKQIHIENRNDRENKWKEAILEFETNINAPPPSLETSWTFSMAIFYVGTIYTTIGYGNIACATTTGRIVSIIYAFIGIPIFLIILNNLNEFLLKKIKMISILFEDNIFYYSMKLGLLKLEDEKKIKYYKKFNNEKNTDNELIELSNVTDTNDTCITINVEEEEEKNVIHNPPILTGVLVTLIWIFLSAGLFCLWEDWTYGSSTYFIFISLLTIGFGDIYPVHRPELFCWAFGAVIVGLSLVTVCISLCQEKIELLYKAILDKLLEDYIRALESGDPEAIKNAIKSKGVKMMEQLKSDAKEKGIDLPSSISSVNPETGRPNFCETNKDKLDDFIKNEDSNIEKDSPILKNKFDQERVKMKSEKVTNSQIQTDESLLDEYIKNTKILNNYDITGTISSIISDDIIQTENKRINNLNDVSSVKIPMTNTSNQTDKILLKDCGIQPDVSYIVKHFPTKSNQFENIILNDEEIKHKSIFSSNENICVNFMKDTALDPIDIITSRNTSTQTQYLTIKSRRSQTRLTGIVKARKNIKSHHNLKEHDIKKIKHKNISTSKSGMTKKEKQHLKNFLLQIRNNDDGKQNIINNFNINVDETNYLTTNEETILLMKELEIYRSKNNTYKIAHDNSNSYDYELKSDIKQHKTPTNVPLDTDNYINKNDKISKELNLQSVPSLSSNNELAINSKNHPIKNNNEIIFKNKLSPILQEENVNVLEKNLIDKLNINKSPTSLQIEELPNQTSLIHSPLNLKKDEERNIKINDNDLSRNINEYNEISQFPQDNIKKCSINELSLDGEKYEEVTINIELVKKLKKDDFKLITSKEKDYISKLAKSKHFLFSDSSGSEEDIDNKKLYDIKNLHDRFSSEDDNLSIEELFTDQWVQTENEIEKPILPLKDSTSQYDKKIDQSYFIEKILQTEDKIFINKINQTMPNEIYSIQCQTDENELHNVECQTMINMDNIHIREPLNDSNIYSNTEIKNIGVQACCNYGNFTCQFNYEIPKIDSQTQYICNNKEFGSQYIYKPKTTSTESQIKAEHMDFSNQYSFTPSTTNSEVQVSYKKKENTTQTKTKFFENQAVQFNLEKLSKETQVGFDDGIISRNTSLKNLTIREGECIKEGAKDISRMSINKKSEKDVSSTTKFTLFEEHSDILLKSKQSESEYLNKEENIIISPHSILPDTNIKKDNFESGIKIQHYNKKLEFTNYETDASYKFFKNELDTEEENFESVISDIKTDNKYKKSSEDVVDVGIQTGVLARVQHIYGEGQKKLKTSDSGSIVSPEFQKVSLKKLHAIDDKGVYRSVDVTPPASPSSSSIKRNLSLKKDRSSKIYNDTLKSPIKESKVPDLIRSFSTYEEQDDSSLNSKVNPSKKNK
uniref:Potassium channel domain-containing protein n=1 Tax=Strongyloides stercoralis TaxID=6248 RepID=A0A0K0E8L1_STRER